MCIINIEEVRASNQLKQVKCYEAKAAIKDILSDDQLEKFDQAFDSVVGKVFKGLILKEKS